MTNAHPIEEMLESVLATLAEDLPPPDDTDQVELVLEQVGGALRAAVPLPRSIAQWLRSIAAESLGRVTERWTERLSHAVLPASDDDVENLSGGASVRDRSESVVVGIRRACFGADRTPGDVPGNMTLLETQRRVDALLKAHVSRAAVEGALGIRRGLLESGAWTESLDERSAESNVDEELSFTGGAPLDAAPPDEVVTAYVADGRNAAWVEGFAARSASFAEELAATIEVFRAEGEPVGLVARRWQQRGAKAVELRFEGRLAASDDPESAKSRVSIRLGMLAPTDAQARLTVEDGRVTVRVLADTGSLRAVRFGGERLGAESSPGAWELSVSWTEAPIPFEVESADGRRFEVALALHSGRDA